MSHSSKTLNRRELLSLASAGAAALASAPFVAAAEKEAFGLRYILGSCMYGYTKLPILMPEVKKIGATAIDIWPKTHGDQREQLDQIGEEQFAKLLKQYQVSLGCLTQYKLGPFGLQKEMRLAKRLGCQLIVTGGKGPKGLKGKELKAAVKKFVEQMKPHLEVAQETGVTIAIENHGNNLVDSPDSLKWLMELSQGHPLGIALAPYHLPQDEKLLAQLIRDLGSRMVMFYAWQHGMGCMTKLPKAQELLQLPGRGNLDFGPLLEAMQAIQYRGFTEIFMHPVPRGIPILESTAAVTKEINRSRAYLEKMI